MEVMKFLNLVVLRLTKFRLVLSLILYFLSEVLSRRHYFGGYIEG